MDASVNVFVWIKDIEWSAGEEGYYLLWGEPFCDKFDPVHREDSNYGVFVGDIKIVGRNDRVLTEVEIGRVHSTRRGFGWSLSRVGEKGLPDPPFLMTNDLGLKRIFSGVIQLAPSVPLSNFLQSEGGREFFESSEHLAKGPNWLGVVTKCHAEGELLVQLTAFSNSNVPRIQELQNVELVDLVGVDLGVITEVRGWGQPPVRGK